MSVMCPWTTVDRVQDNDEVDAEMSFHESVQENLFGDQYVQKTLESSV